MSTSQLTTFLFCAGSVLDEAIYKREIGILVDEKKPREVALSNDILVAAFNSISDALHVAEEILNRRLDGNMALLIDLCDHCGTISDGLVREEFLSFVPSKGNSKHLLISRPALLAMPEVSWLGAVVPVASQSDDLFKIDLSGTSVLRRTDAEVPIHSRRALAGILDYLLIFLLYISICTVCNFSKIIPGILARNRIEFEHMEIFRGRVVPYWLASSGEAVRMGDLGNLSYEFEFDSGTYDIYASLRLFGGLDVVSLQVGETKYTRSLIKRNRFFNYEPLVKEIFITKGEIITFRYSSPMDYVDFVRTGDVVASERIGMRTNRLEEALRLCGLWSDEEEAQQYLLFLVFIPLGQLLMHILSVTFWGTTPGARAFGLVVRTNDDKRVNLARAMLRGFGYCLSLLSFGIGIVWYLVTSKSGNWPDIISNTKVVSKEVV